MKSWRRPVLRAPVSSSGNLSRRRSVSYDVTSSSLTDYKTVDDGDEEDTEAPPPRHSPPVPRKLLPRPLSASPLRRQPSSPLAHHLPGRAASSSSRSSSVQLTALSGKSGREKHGLESPRANNSLLRSESCRSSLSQRASQTTSKIPRYLGLSASRREVHPLNGTSELQPPPPPAAAVQPFPSPSSLHFIPAQSSTGTTFSETTRRPLSADSSSDDERPFISANARQNFLYTLKIIVLVLAIGIVVLVKVALFIAKYATIFWKLLVKVVTTAAVQSDAAFRQIHLGWRDSLQRALTMAIRFQTRVDLRHQTSVHESKPSTCICRQRTPPSALVSPPPTAMLLDSPPNKMSAESKGLVTRSRTFVCSKSILGRKFEPATGKTSTVGRRHV